MLGPTVVMPGSGGGPSHGAMIRASTPELAQRAGEPEHLALHAAEERQRVRARPDIDPERHALIIPSGCGRWPGRAGPTARSLGQLGCMQVPVLGRGPDEVLEAVREVLGDPRDVVAEAARRARRVSAGADVARRAARAARK